MAENSKIEWTHHTFNPWIGCQKVGPGCDHCYAEAMMDTRLGRVEWGPHAARSRTSASYWRKPLAWNKAAKAAGERHRVFCASLADVFDNHASIHMYWRLELALLICSTPHLDWLLLTKRIGNADRYLREMFPGGITPNVWLGCTVVNQAEADRDIPKLLAAPAKVRFLSIEPLLGPVNIEQWLHDSHCWEYPGTCICSEPREVSLDWVIVGGESGPGARPMHPDWAGDLRDQCVAAGAAFFFKQWGEWAPSTPDEASGNPHSGWRCLAGHPHVPRASELYPEAGAAFIERKGKKAAGRLLDGRTWDQMPGVTHG